MKRFTLSRKDAGISTLIKVSTDADAAADEIKLPSVTGSVLEHVVVYMRHHKGVEPPVIEKPLRSKIMSEVCPDKADAKFIDAIGELNKQPLYDLILAANYLDIKSLLHLGCAKVASLIKGQPLEKIKEILDPNTKKSDEKVSFLFGSHYLLKYNADILFHRNRNLLHHCL